MTGGAGWRRDTDFEAGEVESMVAAIEQDESLAPLLKKLSSTESESAGRNRLLTWRVNTLVFRNDYQALGQVFRGFAMFDLDSDELSRNTVPTLLMAGTLDPMMVGIKRLEPAMSNTEVMYVEQENHFDTQGKPAYTEKLLAFIYRTASADSSPSPWLHSLRCTLRLQCPQSVPGVVEKQGEAHWGGGHY